MELHCPELFRQQAFVNGSWCEADSGARTEIFNPANGERLGSVPNMGAAETRRAIEAAQQAHAAVEAAQLVAHHEVQRHCGQQVDQEPTCFWGVGVTSQVGQYDVMDTDMTS
mgnify:CR=1 FL=1